MIVVKARAASTDAARMLYSSPLCQYTSQPR